MPERHVQCRACGVIRPASEARSIPTFRAETNAYVDGYYCEAHAMAALDAARTHIAALDLEDDERDDMMPLVLLIALIRARGLMSESLAPGEAQGEGMERVRQEALALLGRLTEARLPIVEGSALCSACFRALPASQIRVIPWHNDGVGDFVTTFRCGECVAESLAETRSRLVAGDARDVAQLAAFFERHAITILEHRRGDPPEVVRPLLVQLLGMIERGDLTLAIGETVPLKDVLAAAPQPPPDSTGPGSPPQTASPIQAPPSGPGGSAEPGRAASPPSPAPAPAASLWSRLRRALGLGRDRS